MRTLGTTVLALGAAVLLAGPAQAQGFRGGMFGGGGYMLLSNKGVQQELKLTDAQAEKVTRVVEEASAKAREKWQDLPDDERREKGRAIFQAANDEVKATVKDVLKPEQVARLDQISLQQQGITAFADPKAQGKLGLSDDQRSKLREIADDADRKMRDLREGFANDREGTMEKMRAARKESMDKALGVLTDGQKKSWKEMTGEPFEVRFERRPGN